METLRRGVENGGARYAGDERRAGDLLLPRAIGRPSTPTEPSEHAEHVSSERPDFGNTVRGPGDSGSLGQDVWEAPDSEGCAGPRGTHLGVLV